MKRQQNRQALILISFLLFPATIFYFSPVLIIIAASRGIVAGCFIVFLLQFLGSILLGRLFCGWICPAAGLQEACFAIKDKAVSNRFDRIKYFIWAPWIVGIIVAAATAGGFRNIDPLFQTKYGISVAEPGAYIIYFVVTGLILILALKFGKRAFCHYGCWMAPFMIFGTKLGNRLKIPRLALKADRTACIDCRRCTNTCPMSLQVMKMIKSGSMTNAECILCGNCIDVCPRKVIRFTFSRPESPKRTD